MKQIFQHDSMECGAACLAMICSHFNKPMPLKEIVKACNATREGVSMLGLKQVATEIGFEVIIAQGKIEDLDNEDLPCILYWNQNHFVVLYKIDVKKQQYYLADPAKGKCKYGKEYIQEHWINIDDKGNHSGIAMFFENRFSLKKKYDLSEERSFSFLFSYIRQYQKFFFQISLGLLLGCLLQLLMPFLTQAIVDVGIAHRDIGLSFFDTKLMGDLLQRMNDHSRVQSFLTNQVLGVMFSMLSFVVFGIVLFIYDVSIFGIFVAGSIMYGLWIAHFLSRRKVIDYELFEQQAINQNKTYEFVTTMQEIKLQDCEQRRRWEWEDTQADLFDVQMKSLKLQQTQEAGSIFINELKNILITVFAATAVINQSITLGTMLAIQYIVGQLNSPVEQLMRFIYSLQDVKISLERINEIHLSKNEESQDSQCQSFDSHKSIIFESVDFKYDPHALKNTLSDISFEIPEGKVTAIVGASGSGKTTLIKLMLGYYRVLSGHIAIAGRDINEYNLKWWRRHCGVVMQDGVIFSESIARNIAVDDGEIDVERLEQAAKIANIHDYVMGLPLKYNTKIGRDGVGLSQGQKQRILIARAVYKNPDFIFLDEATNALDAKNERAIVENLGEFYKGRTVVVVAHRLSTVKNADQIIVLDAGRIVESGTHASLIAAQGSYYNLVKNQLELGN